MRFISLAFLLILVSSCDGYYGYPNPEEGCFTAGTMVSVPRGQKVIESLKIGDAVYAFDEERAQLVTGIIDHVQERFVTRLLMITLENEAILRVTEEHPLYLAETLAWREAGQLKVGDRLMVLSEEDLLQPLRIRGITVQDLSEPIPVYNFKVREYMTSFAEGVLAHFYDI